VSGADGVVSFLVLSFNSADVLAECLHAVTAQRDAQVEVLCLDNASADASVEIARSYGLNNVSGIVENARNNFDACLGEIALRHADV